MQRVFGGETFRKHLHPFSCIAIPQIHLWFQPSAFVVLMLRKRYVSSSTRRRWSPRQLETAGMRASQRREWWWRESRVTQEASFVLATINISIHRLLARYQSENSEFRRCIRLKGRQLASRRLVPATTNARTATPRRNRKKARRGNRSMPPPSRRPHTAARQSPACLGHACARPRQPRFMCRIAALRHAVHTTRQSA